MSQELSADYVRKSYRYLRLGLIASVALLAVSLWLEIGAAPGCLQTSISGYYYTPVRAVFVAVLLAIGVALIVIKGRQWEDLWLNLAGMLAPVVAFVPTRNAHGCWSSAPPALPIERTAEGEKVLAEWVAANIGNNLRALIIVGLLAVLVAIVVLIRFDGHSYQPLLWLRDADGVVRRGIPIMALVIVAVWVLYETEWEWFRSQMHNFAAIAMFVFLGAASAVNAFRKSKRGIRREIEEAGRTDDEVHAAVIAAFDETKGYFRSYVIVPTAMLAAAIIIGLISVFGDWDHSVFFLEAVEIGIFALYWLVQTVEHWNEDVAVTA